MGPLIFKIKNKIKSSSPSVSFRNVWHLTDSATPQDLNNKQKEKYF